MKRVHGKLTYANVVATLALFVALGGGAYAVSNKAPKNSVDSRAVVDDSLKSVDVKDHSLAAKDIENSVLGGGGGPPSGPAGGDLSGNYPKPQIAPGAVGPGALQSGVVTASKLGDIVKVEDAVNILAGSSGQAEAPCPAGTRLLSGGFFAGPGIQQIQDFGDFDAGNSGAGDWVARGVNTSPGAGTSPLTVQAYCLE